jgi:hypothetical protein
VKSLAKRVARLEKVEPDVSRPSLVVVHGVGFDPDSLTGVDGVDLPRLDDESADEFIVRLEAHVRATRGRMGALITFARYGDDDAPNAPAPSTLLD